jgi:DNA-binding NarL/FixJ family response regulator
LAVGASGYLLKQTSLEILTKGIQEVAKGNPFFSPLIFSRLSERNRKSPNHAGNLRGKNVCLSPRESETLQLIAEGNPNKRIAADLNISIKTVEKHRHRLMEKLDIHDTATLTRYALAEGIIESGGLMGAFE